MATILRQRRVKEMARIGGQALVSFCSPVQPAAICQLVQARLRRLFSWASV
jgi:hypothetical protein